MDVNEWCTSALFFDSVSFNPCIAFTLHVKSNAPIPHLKMNETKRKMTTIAESWLRQSAKRISTACQLSIHGSPTSALWEGNSTVFRWDNKTELSDGKIFEKTGLFKNARYLPAMNTDWVGAPAPDVPWRPVGWQEPGTQTQERSFSLLNLALL